MSEVIEQQQEIEQQKIEDGEIQTETKKRSRNNKTTEKKEPKPKQPTTKQLQRNMLAAQNKLNDARPEFEKLYSNLPENLRAEALAKALELFELLLSTARNEYIAHCQKHSDDIIDGMDKHLMGVLKQIPHLFAYQLVEDEQQQRSNIQQIIDNLFSLYKRSADEEIANFHEQQREKRANAVKQGKETRDKNKKKAKTESSSNE